MTVNFQIFGEPVEAEIRYDTESRGGEHGAYLYSSSVATSTIEGLFPERSIYWSNLVGLDADMSCCFVIGSEKLGFSQEFKFRTVPSDDKEIRFKAIGLNGDVLDWYVIPNKISASMKLEP